MKNIELLRFFDEYDKQGKWIFKLADFIMYFRKESEQNIKISLSRLAKQGYLVSISKGIYANPRAKSMLKGYFPGEVANSLRDKAYSYLSLETLLSEEGLISQIPNCLTFVSLKFSRTYNTPYGIIEYVQTKRSVRNFLKDCYYDSTRGFWVANTQKAIDDLYNFNRCVDLYEEQLQKDKEYGFI